jgi:hypothetical protein
MTTNEKWIDAIVAILATVPLIWLRAWVIVKLWSWFVVPLGVKPLTIGLAIGLCIVVALLKGIKRPGYEPSRSWPGMQASIYSLFVSLASWGTGAIYLHFV